MCRFIETICIDNGEIRNLPYHDRRLNHTRQHFWERSTPLQLSDYILPPQEAGKIKVRVVYGEAGMEEISYSPYSLRKVQTLALIRCDDIDYPYKSTDREALNRLFAHRGMCDDILLVKEGLITDTTIANIAFYDGNSWYTPQHPLLKGTKRAQLLDQGLLLEKDLKPEDLSSFIAIRLFNAMIDWGELELPIQALRTNF
ncbi:aminotransferase class IV family protein [uncultured Bacteroides sp.]|uniref:aminotransferase class IV family protein n=1 Tax=uncultured Bacteroides sp. TaxID=162156 RepID=UPI0026267A04|nr:aminotransferase class IV family protein [uncultured Bacteroides sp.]